MLLQERDFWIDNDDWSQFAVCVSELSLVEGGRCVFVDIFWPLCVWNFWNFIFSNIVFIEGEFARVVKEPNLGYLVSILVIFFFF